MEPSIDIGTVANSGSVGMYLYIIKNFQHNSNQKVYSIGWPNPKVQSQKPIATIINTRKRDFICKI